MCLKLAHEGDEQAQDDGNQEATLTANVGSTEAAIEDNTVGIKGNCPNMTSTGEKRSAVEVEGTSQDIASLASQIVSSDSKITDAVAVREEETKDPSVSEAELLDVIDTLQRMIRILPEEMTNNPKNQAVLQKKTDTHIMNRVSATISLQLSMMQRSPVVTGRSGWHSYSVDMTKTSVQVTARAHRHSDHRSAEEGSTRARQSNAAHDFAMLKQSLQDQWAQDSQALYKARSERKYRVCDSFDSGESRSRRS